ncbi:hypothetical protein [uncultured Roseovarius sp.]|uniref:CBU_0592 family membrane protein n=1 Tax=uncultured Roseovarius sp. TaxID=293344 RepID=UPI00261D5145|nr:hypothetical protein [uncultured Roseovarius sp.]
MQTIIEFIRSYPDIAELIGVIGFMIYIGGFFSVQSGFMCGNGIAFPMVQVTAASFVLVSLTTAYNLPAFMIQTSYIAIGIFGIVLRLRRVRSNRERPANPARAARMRAPIRFDADCHEPATLFRHSKDQSDSPNPQTLCS